MKISKLTEEREREREKYFTKRNNDDGFLVGPPWTKQVDLICSVPIESLFGQRGYVLYMYVSVIWSGWNSRGCNFSKRIYTRRGGSSRPCARCAAGNIRVDSLYNFGFTTRTGEVNVPCKRRASTQHILAQRRREEHYNSEAICRNRLEPEVSR